MNQNRKEIDALIAAGAWHRAGEALQRMPHGAWQSKRAGQISLGQGRLNDAASHLQTAMALDSSDRETYRLLASVLARAGKLQEAVQVFEKAVKAFPGDPIGYRGIGECLVVARDYRKALEFLTYAWTLDKSDHRLGAETAKLLMQFGNYAPARPMLEAAHEACPDDPGYLFQLAELYFYLDDPERALDLFRRVTSGEQGEVARLRQAACLITMDQADEADALLASLLENSALDRGGLLGCQAQVAMMLGDTDRATRLCREALACSPTDDNAWYTLVQVCNGELSDEEVAALESAYASQPVASRIVLGFALAQVYEKRKQLAPQIETLHEVNRLKALSVTLDRGATTRYLSAIRDRFDSLPVIEPNASLVPRPLFIVGLPRSGTTLIEQVLSSHSSVEAGGESLAFNSAANRIARELGLSSYQNLWTRDDTSWVKQLGQYYCEFHRAQGRQSACVTDKAILLYRYLGALAAALPEACFVVLHRHPLDLALGQYKQLFASGQQFSYSAEGIAATLADFYTQIHHWEKIGVNMLHLRYEHFVHDQEAATRALLQYCRLDWEESCLSFHQNRRVVATASVAQVREGLFTSAAGRWQRYGDLLAPFGKAFSDAGIDVSAYGEGTVPAVLSRAASGYAPAG